MIPVRRWRYWATLKRVRAIHFVLCRTLRECLFHDRHHTIASHFSHTRRVVVKSYPRNRSVKITLTNRQYPTAVLRSIFPLSFSTTATQIFRWKLIATRGVSRDRHTWTENGLFVCTQCTSFGQCVVSGLKNRNVSWPAESRDLQLEKRRSTVQTSLGNITLGRGVKSRPCD